MKPFPHKKVASFQTEIAHFFPYVTLELFCTCHMPETYDDMVECEECGEWFYLKCMGPTKEPTEDELWFCNKLLIVANSFYLHLIVPPLAQCCFFGASCLT